MKKVLIVDDSKVMREYIKKIINESGEFEVIGEAQNGVESIQKALELNPDLIVMDIVMPEKNGLEATEEIIAHRPIPILIFSSTVKDEDVEYAYNAIKLGAVDVMAKPDSLHLSEDSFKSEFLRKLRIISNVKVIRRPLSMKDKKAIKSTLAQKKECIGIGASTGGPQAIRIILNSLGHVEPPIFITQHMAKGFDRGFVRWLRAETGLNIVLGDDGVPVEKGKIYVAPSGVHLVVSGGRVYLDDSPPRKSCKPSVDVMFSSLAEEYEKRLVVALLTGIGDDGVDGCRKVKEKGGYVIAQDEKTSAIYGMPASAVKEGVVDTVLSIDRIPELLRNFAGS